MAYYISTNKADLEAYNEQVGGSSNSQHKLGRAVDIIVTGVDPDDVADFAEELLKEIGHGGIGRYSTFTHIDTRSGEKIARWEGYTN